MVQLRIGKLIGVSALSLVLSLTVTAGSGGGCGSDASRPDAAREASGPCGPLTCNGCCQGQRCLQGEAAPACGAGGLSCVVCQGSDSCVQGQCLPYNAKCNPAICASGCCQEDSCQPGTAAGACGKGGLPCVACASSQKCEGQTCGCTPATCSGCCDSGGVCRSGTTEAACGSTGKSCGKCSTGQTCAGGACQGSGTCSVLTCKGCCAGAECKPGTSDAKACGKYGLSCQTCGTGESCTNSVCNNPTSCGPTSCAGGCCQGSKCLSGTAATGCGTGGKNCQSCAAIALCDAGQCKLKPTSSWGITIVLAELDTSKTWDWPFYVEPDVYVEVKVGTASGKTTIKSNTWTPQWDEFVLATTAGDLAAGKMLVTLFDSDPLGSEVIGTCAVSVAEDVLLAGYGVVSSCGAEGWVKKIEFKFTAQ